MLAILHISALEASVRGSRESLSKSAVEGSSGHQHLLLQHGRTDASFLVRPRSFESEGVDKDLRSFMPSE